jgi:hypothetical protein
MANTLLHITRLNWLAPDEEELFNEVYTKEVMPQVLRRPGVLRGARYRVVHGPGYVGWDGPSHAYQYLHVFELEDSDVARQMTVEPLELGASLKKEGRPLIDKLLAVSGVYRRMSGRGDVGFTPLLYCTRYEIRPPEVKEDWNRFYDEVVRGRIFSRPGIGAGARYVLERGPAFTGWLGPEGSSLYFNLYEVNGEEWIEKVMPPLETIKQWSATEPFGLQNLNEVRAVYRRL